MSTSLIANDTSLVTYDILTDGALIPGEHQIVSINVSRAVNRIGTATVTIVDGGFSGLAEDFPSSNSGLFDPGKKITIKAGYHAKNEIIFEGIIVKQGLSLSHDSRKLIIDCKEEAYKMALARNNAIFLDKTDSQVISDLIGKSGLQATVTSTEATHPELVQYFCSDWDYMLMRADFNGHIVVTEGSKIKVGKPDVSSAPVVEVVNGQTLMEIDVEIDARNQFPKVTSTAWDVATQKILDANSGSVTVPAVGITPDKLSSVHGIAEYHLQTPANLPNNVLQAWATGKLTRSKLSMLQGHAKFIGSALVKPDVVLTLKGLSDHFNGDVYVSAVNHVLEDGEWLTQASFGISFKSYSESNNDIVAPSVSGITAGIKGLQTAIVKKIDADPAGQHRIQISYPTLKQDNMGIWARLSTFYATNGSGTFFIPEINDEVVIGFLNEDPEQPIILGSVYSAKNVPAFTSEEKNNTKSFVTRSKMKLTFDEEKKIITIITPGNNSIVLDDDKGAITATDKNNNKMEMTDAGITFDCVKDFTIKAQGKVIIEAQQDIQAKATGNLKGEGMAVELKGSTKFAAEAAMAEVKGSGQTVIKGGVVMIN
ncbi:MAG: type VI secretion system tip protein VgrG [Sporocytophaga sp.]|uniref:type VI secretion system tip protein VgrG n=1 Tax=Sporocytophaga sp. TaxID=2231183 RepID=UPI001B068CFA|nr:type VI secretion system tip protein VgrG [Sporocytophaga sp.]MBO9700578.1 type VI secretion system tip protein VgrG [Sporocytophaga sp.]